MSATKKILRERHRHGAHPNVTPVFGAVDQRALKEGVSVHPALVYAPRNPQDCSPWLEPFTGFRYKATQVCVDVETVERPELEAVPDDHPKILAAMRGARERGFDPGPLPWKYRRKQA
jgi:hypothetical protein